MDDFKGHICSLKVYGDDFRVFFNNQTPKVQARILWTIRLIRDIQIVPQNYLKHMQGTDGLYEIRVSAGNNIFRIFCFFDEGKLVILLNGFQKRRRKHQSRKLKEQKD